MDRAEKLTRRIRILLFGFILGLAVSGITAFPLPQEIAALARWLGPGESWLHQWIAFVDQGVRETDARFPFLFYGTDWLAFGHLVIALAFVGPIRDPVRNVWIIQWGMIACVAVIPLALICGPARGIPFYWQLIDCSFGVVGFVPLWCCLRWIREIELVRGKG